jgi:hypothetical protein
MAYVKQHSILCFITPCSVLVDKLDHDVRSAAYFILSDLGDCLVAHFPSVETWDNLSQFVYTSQNKIFDHFVSTLSI